MEMENIIFDDLITKPAGGILKIDIPILNPLSAKIISNPVIETMRNNAKLIEDFYSWVRIHHILHDIIDGMSVSYVAQNNPDKLSTFINKQLPREDTPICEFLLCEHGQTKGLEDCWLHGYIVGCLYFDKDLNKLYSTGEMSKCGYYQENFIPHFCQTMEIKMEHFISTEGMWYPYIQFEFPIDGSCRIKFGHDLTAIIPCDPKILVRFIKALVKFINAQLYWNREAIFK